MEIFDDLAHFPQNSRILKKISGDEFKSQGPEIWKSSPSYTYLSPCNVDKNIVGTDPRDVEAVKVVIAESSDKEVVNNKTENNDENVSLKVKK